MKKTLLLLTAAGCLALPVLSHAEDPTPAKSKKKTEKTATVVRTAAPKERVVYYTTGATYVGSHIPMVYSRTNGGQREAVSNTVVYNSTILGTTGSLNVGDALNEVDPAISISHGR